MWENVDPWQYRCRCERVIDGDTIILYIDKGFNSFERQRIRLLDVDTAELPSHLYFPNVSVGDLDEEEHAEALAHLWFVEEWIYEAKQGHDGPWPLVVETVKDRTSKYGRYQGKVYRKTDGAELTMDLVDEFGDAVKSPSNP